MKQTIKDEEAKTALEIEYEGKKYWHPLQFLRRIWVLLSNPFLYVFYGKIRW